MDELLCSYEWTQVVHTRGEVSTSPPQVRKFFWREELSTAACRGGWATTDNIEIKQADTFHKHGPLGVLLHEGKHQQVCSLNNTSNLVYSNIILLDFSSKVHSKSEPFFIFHLTCHHHPSIENCKSHIAKKELWSPRVILMWFLHFVQVGVSQIH